MNVCRRSMGFDGGIVGAGVAQASGRLEPLALLYI